MHTLFLDANIFFAAVRSHAGGSYFILQLARAGRIKLITVAHALAEAERNINAKLRIAALQEHYDNLLCTRPVIQSLGRELEELEAVYRSFVVDKDLPILLGAVLSEADFLITLDRKHLLNNLALAVSCPMPIVTPGDYLQKYFS